LSDSADDPALPAGNGCGARHKGGAAVNRQRNVCKSDGATVSLPAPHAIWCHTIANKLIGSNEKGGPVIRRKSKHRILMDRRAMTAWEYSLIAALVAVAIIGSLSSLGSSTMNPLRTISSSVTWNASSN
jgi:Flp pilus assembly pilin Flp